MPLVEVPAVVLFDIQRHNIAWPGIRVSTCLGRQDSGDPASWHPGIHLGMHLMRIHAHPQLAVDSIQKKDRLSLSQTGSS